jgi:hypothetical protein
MLNGIGTARLNSRPESCCARRQLMEPYRSARDRLRSPAPTPALDVAPAAPDRLAHLRDAAASTAAYAATLTCAEDRTGPPRPCDPAPCGSVDAELLALATEFQSVDARMRVERIVGAAG